MIICPQCSQQNEDGAVFCENCGAQLAQPLVVPSGMPAASPTPQSYPPLAAPPVAPMQPGMGAAPTAGGAVCTACGTPLPAGAAFCDNCGAPVAAGGGGAQPVQSQSQPAMQQHQSPVQQPFQQPVQQPFQQPVQQPYQQPVPQPAYGAPPRLVVQASGAQIALSPGKMEYIVGREDPVSNTFPDVDMALHGGDEGGVSRRHARLYQQGGQWFVEDYGSTNFTFVNNQKVLPNAPLPLQNGSELRFGRVKLTFYMQ